MSKTLLAALTLAAVVACADERRDSAVADSLERDLQLAPVDTTAELSDRPAAEEPAPAERTPARRTPPATPAAAPATPPAAAPAPAGLAAGTRFSASTTAEIRSHKNKVGDTVMARVAKDVKNSAGQVVIPAGSEVVLKVTAIKEAENRSDTTGTLTIQPVAVQMNGRSYPVNASIQGVNTRLEGRATNVGDVAKPAAGAAVGAVVGRVLGGSTKGAIIGGVIGGAVGAQRAVETKDRDVVLPEGTAVTLVLDESFKPAT